MPPTRFLKDYWQKRPLLIRGAFARFRDPLEPEDLAGLACGELALARIVVHEHGTRKAADSTRRREDASRRDSRANRSDRWTVRDGPFADPDFASLPPTGWTLLVQDVDKWDVDVRALLDHFEFLPNWRIDDVMVSYAVEGGSVGPHIDQYDVFLLQGLGQRRWHVAANGAEENSADRHGSRRDEPSSSLDTELKLLREFRPTHEWTLDTGDMLYLPPGIAHWGIARSACMTYSIGMRAPSQAELLIAFADTIAEKLAESERLIDPDLMPARRHGEIDDAAIARVAQAMPWLRVEEAGIGVFDLRRWFGRFITRYRCAHLATARATPLTDAAFARLARSKVQLRRNPWSRFAWVKRERGALLFVAGGEYACSTHLARLLCEKMEFALTTISSESDRQPLRALIDAGHLVPSRVRTNRQRKKA